ncbi:MAG: copper-binding protein, partial [Stellaceae bacterium]
LLLAAGINRFDLTPHLAGPTAAPFLRRLRGSVMLELALGFLLVLAAATLATEAPAAHELPRWPFRLVAEWRLLPQAAGAERECLNAGLALAALGLIALCWQRFRRGGAALAVVALAVLAATQVRVQALPDLVRGTGTVVATEPASRLLVVNGDAIPGFMAAMTMPYAVASPALLQAVRPDERVEFDLDPKTLTITAVRAAGKPR